MAQARKFDDDSDSSDDLGIHHHMPMPLAAHLESCYYPDPAHNRHHPRPVFLPPPTEAATAKIKRKKIARPKPEPLIALPPVPPIPPLATAAASSAIPDMPKMAVGSAVAPSKVRRKTLLERIDGWWDLGLLDKRQTLFRSQSKMMAERKV